MHWLLRLLFGQMTAVLLFGCSKAERFRGTAPPEDSVQVSSVGGSAFVSRTTRYQEPLLDLPAQRLSERVDGAEVKLRTLGCTRLRVWRSREIPADLELYSFSNEQGAKAMLVEQIGAERASNAPGDEGWLGTNALYFRRGLVLVRLIGDAPISPEALLAVARSMEQALVKGEVVP